MNRNRWVHVDGVVELILSKLFGLFKEGGELTIEKIYKIFSFLSYRYGPIIGPA